MVDLGRYECRKCGEVTETPYGKGKPKKCPKCGADAENLRLVHPRVIKEAEATAYP